MPNPTPAPATPAADPVAALAELNTRLGAVAEKSEVEALRAELKTAQEEISTIRKNISNVPWSQREANKDRTFQYRKLIRKLADQTRGFDTPWDKFGGEFERDAIGECEKEYGHIRNINSTASRASTLVTTGNTLGGYLVPDVIGGYSDILRSRNPIFSKFGADIIQTTGMPYKWNRMSTASSLTALNEGAALTQSDVAFEQDQYMPKKYGAYIYISSESIMMDDPSIEMAVRTELLGRLSVNVATQMLVGTGVGGNPTGISVDSRTPTFSTNTNPLTVAGLMGVIETLKTNNALLDGNRLGWVMHPFTESAIMALSQSGTGSSLLFPSNGGNYANEGLGIFGIPYATTTVLGGAENTSDLLLADWTQYALLRWGALEVGVNPNVAWLNDNLCIRAIDRINVLIRQPKAAVFVTDIGKA